MNIFSKSPRMIFFRSTFKNIFPHKSLAGKSLKQTLRQVKQKPLMSQVHVQNAKCSKALNRVK